MIRPRLWSQRIARVATNLRVMANQTAAKELALISEISAAISKHEGNAICSWLSPWIVKAAPLLACW